MVDKRELITKPPPKGRYMQMTIVRNKSGFLNAFYPVYHMYFSENMNIHVLSAKKKSKHKNPSYVFSMSKKDFNEKKKNVLGRIISNIWGTMFVLYSTGSLLFGYQRLGFGILRNNKWICCGLENLKLGNNKFGLFVLYR